MYACICNAVSVSEVEDAVTSGAHCIDSVGAATRAGTTCGTCHDHLDEIIDRCGPCPRRMLSSVA